MVDTPIDPSVPPPVLVATLKDWLFNSKYTALIIVALIGLAAFVF